MHSSKRIATGDSSSNARLIQTLQRREIGKHFLNQQRGVRQMLLLLFHLQSFTNSDAVHRMQL
jgi:hypothetical protein